MKNKLIKKNKIDELKNTIKKIKNDKDKIEQKMDLVIKELEELGIRTVDELPENETGICVIRSHGASPQVIEDIQKRGFEVSVNLHQSE